MFGILKSITQAALGIIFSPVSIAADILTCGGIALDADEPYTVTSVRNILQNLENAVDPDELSDDQIREIICELKRR